MNVPTAIVDYGGEQITVRIVERRGSCHMFYFRIGEDLPFQAQSMVNMSLARYHANDLFALEECDWQYEDWSPTPEKVTTAPTATGSHKSVEITVWIERQLEGFYVFFFKNGEANPFRDELQPTLESAKLAAGDYCGIGKDSWQEADWVPIMAWSFVDEE